MNSKKNLVPGWFILVAILALFWNVAGVARFMHEMTMTADTFALLSSAEQNLRLSAPGWVLWAFGVAVTCGSLGSLLMIMRKSAASFFMQLSLAAVLLQMLHLLFMTRTVEVLGPQAMVLPVVVIAVAAGLALLAFKANSVGWLK